MVVKNGGVNSIRIDSKDRAVWERKSEASAQLWGEIMLDKYGYVYHVDPI